MTGEGCWVHPDGSVYAGGVRDGHKHGRGVLWTADGRSCYHGQWEDGLAVGEGLLLLPAGEVGCFSLHIVIIITIIITVIIISSRSSSISSSRMASLSARASSSSPPARSAPYF